MNDKFGRLVENESYIKMTPARAILLGDKPSFVKKYASYEITFLAGFITCIVLVEFIV